MQLTRSSTSALLAWLLLIGSASAERAVVFDGVRELEISDGVSLDELVEVRITGESAAFEAQSHWVYGRVFEIGERLSELIVRPVVVELDLRLGSHHADGLTWTPVERLAPGDYATVGPDGFPGRFGRFRVGIHELGVQLADEAERSLREGRALQAEALLSAALDYELREDEVPASLQGTLDGVRARRTCGDLRMVATAIESFSIDNERYPTVGPTLSSLVELVSPTYIRELPLRDAWSRDFDYRSDGEAYLLVSSGADGRRSRRSLEFGAEAEPGSDDIVYESGSFRSLGRGSDAQRELARAAERVDAMLDGEAGRRRYVLERLAELVGELDSMRKAQGLPAVVEPTPFAVALGWPVTDIHGRSFLYRSDGHRYELIVPDADGSYEKPTRWPVYEDGKSVSVACECKREDDRRSCRLHR